MTEPLKSKKMALHKDFPSSPYEILKPEIRWLPSDNLLQESSYNKLLPPLVDKLRKAVYDWRNKDYAGASHTSQALLNWWFKEQTLRENSWQSWQSFQSGQSWQSFASLQSFEGIRSFASPQSSPSPQIFKYYFAQREAVETVIYLHDVAKVKSPQDLMKFDSSGEISHNMFDENWPRFVIKMATGSGKTKVLSLLLAWSYFHKLYEGDSDLSKNFLVIAPNIIVLDRLRSDFEGLKIFYQDPILPSNGYQERNWKTDFELSLHIQDQLKKINPQGNIFLTNIHRVYTGDDTLPSWTDKSRTDYFLGLKGVSQTSDTKTDLGRLIREIDELLVFNDEAHHIHDRKLAWFDAIKDINSRLKLKKSFLSLQLDLTATPRHNKGSIFVQTVSDYPLVEAVAQNIVKQIVLPDKKSRDKLQERQAIKIIDKYKDYIHLGVLEWKKAYKQNNKMGKKSILFIMTDDTANCDDVAKYLESTYPDLKNAVLSIHTNRKGEISESKKAELENLRLQANSIDSLDNPYKAIVSVLVLKEGWDVKNVTTIVGLRAYVAKSNILPEQTLGRGLRLMYQDNILEKVSVIGTKAFIDFVESIQKEGVKLSYEDMGEISPAKAPLIVEIEFKNPAKDISKLDIAVPVLDPKTYREYHNLSDLDVSQFVFQPVKLKIFNPPSPPYQGGNASGKIFDIDKGGNASGETLDKGGNTAGTNLNKEGGIVGSHQSLPIPIDFKYMVQKNPDEEGEEYSHTVFLNHFEPINYKNVIGFFAKSIQQELKLLSSYPVLYQKVQEFVKKHLFSQTVDLNQTNTIKNLSEPHVTKLIIDTFKKEINAFTLRQRSKPDLKPSPIRISNTRPFVISSTGFSAPQKSLFNKIVGDSPLELDFAIFLDNCPDIISFAKNYYAVGFKLDYIDPDGFLKNYVPDFFVKKSEAEFYIVETKGREDLKDPLKMKRLKQFSLDVRESDWPDKWGFVFVDEDSFKKYPPKNFQNLLDTFTKYQD